VRRFIGDVRHLYEIKYISFRIIPCRVDLPFCRSLLRRGKEALRNRIIMTVTTSAYPVLQALYAAKQKLICFVLLKTLKARRAGAKLPGFLTLLEQLQDNSLRMLTKTLKSWLELLIAMWHLSKSNGITEGFHNRMEMMSRRAYGFRNFENYRLRVLAHCGWDSVRLERGYCRSFS